MQEIVAKKQYLYGVKRKKTKHNLFRFQKCISTNLTTSFLEGLVKENFYRYFFIYSEKKGSVQLLFSPWIKEFLSVQKRFGRKTIDLYNLFQCGGLASKYIFFRMSFRTLTVRNYFNSRNSEEKYFSASFWFWDFFCCCCCWFCLLKSW